MVTNLAANEEQSGSYLSPGEPLYASVSGAGTPIILLHGLFGMGSNLGGLARALAPEFEVHQLDLPNHGRSPWQAMTSLDDLARSIASYIESHSLKSVAVFGHSLGGKVAMQLALAWPQHVSALVVADIAPVMYPSSHDTVFAALEAVDSAKPASRAKAGEIMRELLSEPDLVPFLALSLKRDEDGTYVWRFNVKALRENYEEFRAAPAGPAFDVPALFVYGLNSSYVDDQGIAKALELFPAAKFEGIADTGHWLHAEKPRQFNAAVLDFFRESLQASPEQISKERESQ
ncbi:alpha/beta fold hydrolase [Congregibacter brevis]|uniref:Alpha/beta fold hydrolase n=1 Tax=Congregibacter brevis TaxID=3081201 RepID=A0ABZ0IAL8_9GAMM|nr:alpha/beta fold hydrolase [Congregibacter sp. IMCC45268]